MTTAITLPLPYNNLPIIYPLTPHTLYCPNINTEINYSNPQTTNHWQYKYSPRPRCKSNNSQGSLNKYQMITNQSQIADILNYKSPPTVNERKPSAIFSYTFVRPDYNQCPPHHLLHYAICITYSHTSRQVINFYTSHSRFNTSHLSGLHNIFM